MWEVRRERFEWWDRFSVLSERAPVTVAEFYGALRRDAAARELLLKALRDSAFPAFFWETPPVTQAMTARAFEFVMVSAPGLAGMAADPSAFAGPFAVQTAASVAVFPNLSGDAVLIAPRPLDNFSCYAHFAVFVRHTTLEQQHELLAVLAETVLDAISERPLWISSSGLGVPWLHLRLDSRPKYYSHMPYRTYSCEDD